MPLRLPPIPLRATGANPGGDALTRRGFLSRAAAGALGALGAQALARLPAGAPALAALPLPQEAAAAAPPTSPQGAWALLADTHIAADISSRRNGQTMASNLLEAAAQVLRSSARAAVIAGDLAVDEGTAGDYRSLLALLEPLRAAGLPVRAILGNHDHRERFLEAAGAGATAIANPAGEGPAGAAFQAPRHCAAQATDGHLWVFLDSLDVTNAAPGSLGPEQTAWLARTLDGGDGSPAILIVHHNPDNPASGLTDSERLLGIIRPRRRVKAVFFGHTHQWRRWEDQGIHMVNLPAVAYAFQADQPLGWVLAAPRPDGLDLELRTLAASPGAGGAAPERVRLVWRPDA